MYLIGKFLTAVENLAEEYDLDAAVVPVSPHVVHVHVQPKDAFHTLFLVRLALDVDRSDEAYLGGCIVRKGDGFRNGRPYNLDKAIDDQTLPLTHLFNAEGMADLVDRIRREFAFQIRSYPDTAAPARDRSPSPRPIGT